VDDLMGKINELLSDEETVKQISGLAQMFMSGESEDEKAKDATETDNSSDSLFGNFDFDIIIKIQEVMSHMNKTDKNSDLLLALKPHLGEEKGQKIDKAVKLLKLLAVWNIVQKTGIIKDLNIL